MPARPGLVLPSNVQPLRTKPVPIKDGNPGWQSALDCLKELVNDIETGRIAPPNLVFVALREPNPNNPHQARHPRYCWTANQDTQKLLFAGLLEHHKLAVLTE